MNELINGTLGYLCAHKGKTGRGESTDDGEMNKMTQNSEHATSQSRRLLTTDDLGKR